MCVRGSDSRCVKSTLQTAELPPWGVVSQRALGLSGQKVVTENSQHFSLQMVYFYIRESLRRIDTLVKSANPQHLPRAWAVELLKREAAQQRTKSLGWHFGVTSEITRFSVHSWVGPFSPAQTHVRTGEGVPSLGSLLAWQSVPLEVISALLV